MSEIVVVIVVAVAAVAFFVLAMSLTLMFKGHHIDSETLVYGGGRRITGLRWHRHSHILLQCRAKRQQNPGQGNLL